MNSLEALLRAEIEPLQYAAFFGALAVFGGLELVAARGAGSSERRRRWPLNYGLTALNIAVLSALPVSGVVAADYARDNHIGMLNHLAVAPFAALAVAVLLRSLVAWTIHLAMHKIPLLWRVHRVHHTDTILDVSTTVRFHPLEFLIAAPALVLSAVALGLSPAALMLYEIFDAAMAVFTHANVRLPGRVERALRWVLVTPDMHRVHHSSRSAETDSNYGATFSVWDRLFGTYRRLQPAALATLQLGLVDCRDRRASSFLWLMSLPARAARIPAQSSGTP